MAKGFDFKGLLLNHGEKFGASVVALIALTGLATANWSTCKLDEGQLASTARQTESSWKSAVNWPDDKKATFENTPDVEELAQRMASPNDDIEAFATTRHWNPPIYQRKAKLAPVTVMPPLEPESDLVIFTLAEKTDEEAADTETLMTETETEKPEENADLAAIFGTQNSGQLGLGQQFPGQTGEEGGLLGNSSDLSGGTTTPGVMPGNMGPGSRGPGGLGAPGAPRSGMGGRMGMGSMPGMGSAPGMGTPGMMSPGMGMGMGMGMGLGMGMEDGSMDGYGMYAGMQNEMKVSLCTGVSVRFVFDMYEQTKLIADALQIPPQEAGRYIDFVNIQIERKRAVPGADPWAGEWESVSLEDVGEILDRSLGTDIEIVNPQVVRSEITMPLPRRAAGKWTTTNASHKRLDRFKLSEEEQEIINKHQAKMLEEANKRKALLPPQQAKSEGFRKYSLGSQDLNFALGNTGEMADQIYQDMMSAEPQGESAGGVNPAESMQARFKNKEDFEKFISQTLATGRLLLIRFMDFTGERGTSYQYRVRLEMRNPNFNRPVDELEEPELATQQTIFSAWSAPTKPVFVPDPYRYYVQKVDSRNNEAVVTMFYEYASAGTPVMASAVQVPTGTRFGGRQQLEVVNLGKSTLEGEEVELKSLDFLASVNEGVRVSANDVQGLRDYLSKVPRGAKPFADRMTVIDANGSIVTRYSGDKIQNGNRAISEEDDRRMAQYVLDTYKHFRPQEAAAGSSIYGEGGESGMPGSMGEMGMGMDMYSGGMGTGSALGGGSRSSRGRGRRGAGGSSGGRSEF
jgi:hypothetical protein